MSLFNISVNNFFYYAWKSKQNKKAIIVLGNNIY